MHIKFDLDDLTLDELEALENARMDPGKGMWPQVREIFARFAYVDDTEDAKKLPYEEALKAVGSLTMKTIRELMDSMKDQMGELADQAIPPGTSEESSPPSEE